MLYKIPMPTKSNGVKILKLNDHQIGVEYQVGEPHVGKMAMDSALGSAARTVTIRRPDIDKIIRDAVRQVYGRDAALPVAGKPPIGNNDMKSDTVEYDDDASKVISTLLSYLEKYLDPDQMEAVTLILSSGDGPDLDTSGEAPQQATDRRRVARLAADQARQRPMSATTEDTYMQLFPNAGRLG